MTWTERVWSQTNVDGTRRLVLLALARHADALGTAVVSMPTLTKEVQKGRRTLQRSVSALEARGLLRRTNAAGEIGHYRLSLPSRGDDTGDARDTGDAASLVTPPVKRKKQQEKAREEKAREKQEKETPRRTRLPEIFPLTDVLRTYCEAKGCRAPARTHEAFVAYYRGSGKPQLDWPATFRAWVLGAHGGPAWKACGCTPAVASNRPPSVRDMARDIAAEWAAEEGRR